MNRCGGVVAAKKNMKRGLPRRGHIKSRIASNAFHSILSLVSRASSTAFLHLHLHLHERDKLHLTRVTKS
ncbi:hypothetical protein HN51_036626 [Arachis hypogaea]